MIAAISEPNSFSTWLTLNFVSSTTSWISPHATVMVSSWSSARIFATSTQWVTYGSPELRSWPRCASSLNR